MRLMLNHVRGATCFQDVRTVNGVVYETCKDSCEALGLLTDDGEYVGGITEASHWGSARFLRHLFTMLLLFRTMARPEEVWRKTCKFLSDDILYIQQKTSHNPGNSFVNFTSLYYSLINIHLF